MWPFKKRKTVEEKSTEGLKEMKTERLGLGYRLAKASQKTYTIKAVIMYNGIPLRRMEFTEKGANRSVAAKKIQDGISIKVVSAYQNK